MKTNSLFLFLFLFIVNISAQTTIAGVVIDASNNQPMPFANVLTDLGEGGIANEKGKFTIDVQNSPKVLIVSYVGYKTIEIEVVADKNFYPIKIEPASLNLSEVEVLAQDKNAAILFYEAIENTRKASYSIHASKMFRRTYSTINDGTPTELLEGYYNTKITEGGVLSFELKNGRIGIPVNSHILQLDLCKVLEHYNFYGDNKGYFPPTPLQEKSQKKLVKGYYIRYAGSFLSGRDTIIEIKFESKKSGSAFDGVAFINKSNQYIIRVVHQVENADFVPFQTVLDKEGTSVENMGIKWDTGFDVVDNAPVPKYMHLVLGFDYLSGENISPLKTNTKLFFYDYEKQFELPIFSEDEELNDYDKIMTIPYNQEFWNRVSALPETGMEELFRKELESNRLFINDDPLSGEIELLNQKYQLIFDGIIPNWGKVAPEKPPTYNRMTGSNLGTDTYNGLFAKTFLALDYNCFPDTTQFRVQAVLDYSQSYMIERNEKEARFFIKFLLLANVHAMEFEKQLTLKYQGKCPSKDEMIVELRNAEKAMRKEIFSKFNGQNKRDEAYLEELDALLGIRKKQL